jgi:hypothetical protein
MKKNVDIGRKPIKLSTTSRNREQWMNLKERQKLESTPWMTYQEAMAYSGFRNRRSFANFLSSHDVKRNPAGSGTIETASLMEALGRRANKH